MTNWAKQTDHIMDRAFALLPVPKQCTKYHFPLLIFISFLLFSLSLFRSVHLCLFENTRYILSVLLFAFRLRMQHTTFVWIHSKYGKKIIHIKRLKQRQQTSALETIWIKSTYVLFFLLLFLLWLHFVFFFLQFAKHPSVRLKWDGVHVRLRAQCGLVVAHKSGQVGMIAQRR